MARPPYVSVHIRSEVPGRRVVAADIVRCIEREIREGRLPAGSRLPPVRALEQALGLSKNTAQAAYDELSARGLLDARAREGVFVASPLDPAGGALATGLAPPLASPLASPARPPSPPPLAARPALLPARTTQRRGVIALSTVFIDPELLPRERLAECARAVLRGGALEPFYAWQGHPGLREAIAARLRARGMDVDAEEVIVTAGSQQALDLVARAAITRRVAVEDPVYSHARMLFESHGMAVTPLPLDPFSGIDLAAWRARLAADRPGLLYAISSFQNPTGYSYSTHELVSLLALCRDLGVAVLEDDWGSDMLSGSEYRPTLRALGGQSVLYANSFTKKILPSLRLGFLVASPPLVPSLVEHKRLSILGNPALLEATLCEFLERGYYDAHLASLQKELDRRYAACLAALTALMPDGVRWTTPGGGPTLWLDLPRTIDLVALRAALLGRDVEIESSDVAFAGAPHLHGFRVSYAYLPEPTLLRAIELLAGELTKLLRA
jgi:2-aminoadipate transaminase